MCIQKYFRYSVGKTLNVRFFFFDSRFKCQCSFVKTAKKKNARKAELELWSTPLYTLQSILCTLIKT